jgi:hypothetical protein
MARRVLVCSSAIALCFAVLVPTARAAPQQIPVMRIAVEQEITAPPAAVWAKLTTGRNLVTWCPVWKSARNVAVRLTKVGDVLDYTDAWGHGGRSVVTFIASGRELRVAHEPADGSYMCQSRFILTPQGGGTLVKYVEQYTDESSPTDRAATAGKMDAALRGELVALKKAVEKK